MERREQRTRQLTGDASNIQLKTLRDLNETAPSG
jgi:hypothetical protein